MNVNYKRCDCGNVHLCRETCTACVERKRVEVVASAGGKLVHHDNLLTADGLRSGDVLERRDAAGNTHRSAPLLQGVRADQALTMTEVMRGGLLGVENQRALQHQQAASQQMQQTLAGELRTSPRANDAGAFIEHVKAEMAQASEELSRATPAGKYEQIMEWYAPTDEDGNRRPGEGFISKETARELMGFPELEDDYPKIKLFKYEPEEQEIRVWPSTRMGAPSVIIPEPGLTRIGVTVTDCEEGQPVKLTEGIRRAIASGALVTCDPYERRR